MLQLGDIFQSPTDNQWYYWTGNSVVGPFTSYTLAYESYMEEHGKEEDNNG